MFSSWNLKIFLRYSEHESYQLWNSNEEALVHLLLDYQGKFNSILNDLKNNFNELKAKFTKLEIDLNLSRNINSKLSDKLLKAE